MTRNPQKEGVLNVYRKVLVAVDLTADSPDTVLTRARHFVAEGGELWAIHVVEPQYIQYSYDPALKSTLSPSLEQSALEAAAARLTEVCERHGIDAEHRYVMLGRVADRVHEVAEEHGFDLIVIGSHGREGLRRLLGSTANAVLHGAPIDVATVRIHRDAS